MFSYEKDFIGDKSPDSIAVQTARVLAYATECELATSEIIQPLKSVSLYRKKRHRAICDKLVDHCYDLKIPPIGLCEHQRCVRLEEEYRKRDKNAQG